MGRRQPGCIQADNVIVGCQFVLYRLRFSEILSCNSRWQVFCHPIGVFEPKLTNRKENEI